MSGPGTLILRADASTEIGTGHVMRSLALAEAWRASGGRTVLVSHCGPALAARIAAHGFQLVALQRVETAPGELDDRLRPLMEHAGGGPVWAALDGYAFEAGCHQAVRRLGPRLLVIDDLAHLARYQADVLLNANLGAEALDYQYDEGAALLLGPRYVLLRPEFQSPVPQREVRPEPRKLLVVLGGSDPGNVTPVLLEAIDRLADLDLVARVVVGPANPNLEGLHALVERSAARVELVVNPSDMRGLMAWADVAVSAAGTTCWELARMQLPALLIVAANNQEHIAAAVAQAGMAESLGRAEGLTPERVAAALRGLCGDVARRQAYAGRGGELIDGRGAQRVVVVMQALDGPLPAAEVRLRFVQPDDLMPLLRLSNEPTVRQSSLCSERITLDAHTGWLTERLLSPYVRMWVLDLHGLLLGHIRYVRETPEVAEISMAVAPGFRRRGLARRLLLETRHDACEELRVSRLRAVVRVENLASSAAFQDAGYRYLETRPVRGQECHIFEACCP